MFDSHGGFEQNQAFRRSRRRDAAAAATLHDLRVIAFRIVAEDRQLESILTFRLGVARPRHAPRFGQCRQHVANK